MKKIGKMNEFAWIFGLIFCKLGVCLCTKANFGLSVIGATPYIIHVWLKNALSWFTQGTSEYIWQGVILIIMCIIIGRFRMRYLLSFGTAVFSGFIMDGWFFLLGGNGAYESLTARIAALILGIIITAFALAFVFRTTLPIQIYDLSVCEVAARYSLDKSKVKLWYDIMMLALAVILSIVFKVKGVGIGTVISAVANAPLIALSGKFVDKIFEFDSLFAARSKKK